MPEEPILGKIRTVEEYIATDGTVFSDEKEAIEYDREIIGGKNLAIIANSLKDRILKRAEGTKDAGAKKIWLEIAGRSLDFDQSPGEKLDYLVLNDWDNLYGFVTKDVLTVIEEVDKSSGK